MKHFTWLVWMLCAVTIGPVKAEVAGEARLIAVVQSSATPAEKEVACQQLKRTGTTASVPALAALLADEHLYQAACDVLEAMPYAEAGEALRTALKTTTGKPKAGVIAALGERQYRAAIPDLAALLSNPDPLLAVYSANALGRMGGPEVVADLRRALATAADPVRRALVDALFQCAVQLSARGDQALAIGIFNQFNKSQESEAIRTAAYAGLIRASGDQALALVVQGIEGDDPARQITALQLAREVRDPAATETFCKLLPKADSPALQAALLGLLQQRGDPAALPTVLVAVRSPDSYVRTAALAALGTLGDASVIPVLAESATSKDESEQHAARVALTQLQRGKVADALVAELVSANSEVQMEVIRALTSRSEKTAVPQLFALARSDAPATRQAALQALSKLAGASDLASLTALTLAAPDDATRATLRGVFESVVDRSGNKTSFDVTPIVTGLGQGTVESRIALLQVAALFADAQLRAAFRAAVKDSDAQLRHGGIRAMCDSRDRELMPDLMEQARTADDATLKALALEGFVRLANDESAGFTAAQRTEFLKTAFTVATRPEDQRLILSALTAVPSPDALGLAERATTAQGIRAEAELASFQIAKALLPTSATAAEASLEKLAAGASNGGVRTNAQALLKQFKSGWLCSGPYRQAGKTSVELFDIPLAPELAQPGQIAWRPAPGSVDLSRPGEVDLASIVGGDQCVVYLKTRVFTPIAQPVALALGSDDGIKLWVNGELVHANNATRGLTPGQDHAKANLRQGWNDFLAKITQQTAGCGMTLSITLPDGSSAPGLRMDPHGAALAAGSTGFQRIQLSDQFYAEGAYYGDFNRDGKLDIVAGPFWFAGPDFKTKHEIRTPTAFNPRDYSDNFLTYTGDFNGDGWVDVFYVPYPGKEGYWFENPGNKGGHWSQYLAYPMVGNESPAWTDVNGDGQPDLVFNNEGQLGYAAFDPAQPDQVWKFHAISSPDKRFQRFTHGVGAGDLNGDGRPDVIEATGWWEQPADRNSTATWKFHPHHFAEAASQMLVTDVDGDGLPDVINAWHCHLYGLVWNRQRRAADGEITWEQNVILSPKPDPHDPGLRFSQLHSMSLADMNGDGLPDIVTGKRFWAHGPAGDVEPNAPAVLYWFELKREGNGKAVFLPHLIDDDSGVGTQVTTVDLNGDHRPDVVVANKKGIFVHLNELR